MSVKDNELLHRAAFDGDIEALERLLFPNSDVDINAYDRHGNTPLILAIHFGRKDVISRLLELGANSFLKSKSGWSPLREAIASKEEETIMIIHKTNIQQSRVDIQLRIFKLIKMLETIPDFYTELKWEFSSWIPFLTRICPSDTYKIWKKGSNLRVDFTLCGYENFKWVRSKLSIVICRSSGILEDTKVVIVDHNLKCFEVINRDEEDFGRCEKNLKYLRSQKLFITQTVTSDFHFKIVNNWRGLPKEETVNGFRCLQYLMNGLVLRGLYRYAHRKSDKNGIDSDNESGLTWDQYINSTFSKGGKLPLLHKNEVVVGKERNFRGTVYISRDFALSSSAILGVFKALNVNDSILFQKFTKFLASKMPENRLPVKLEFNVLPTVICKASFLKYQEGKTQDFADDLFVIPEDFKECPTNFTKR